MKPDVDARACCYVVYDPNNELLFTQLRLPTEHDDGDAVTRFCRWDRGRGGWVTRGRVVVNGNEVDDATLLADGDRVEHDGRLYALLLTGHNFEASFHALIYHLTMHDAWTDLPNGRHLAFLADLECDHDRPTRILELQLPALEDTRDRDRLLRVLTPKLLATASAHGDTVARLDVATLAILLRGNDLDDRVEEWRARAQALGLTTT